MPSPSGLLVLDLAARGGAVTLLAFIAAALCARAWREPAARLGAGLALGAAAYMVCSSPIAHASWGPWAAVLLAIAAGNNLMFWLLARTLFDDGVRLRPAYGLAWLAIAGVGLAGGLTVPGAPLHQALGLAQSLQALGFAMLAVVQTLASWRADLIEPRRRLRVIVVAGTAAHILLSVGTAQAPRLDALPAVALADPLLLLGVAVAAAWGLFRLSPDVLAFRTPAPAVAPPPPLDTDLLARLARHMADRRAWRDEKLSIGRLAHDLAVPEYRLRWTINQGLGHRNFAAYVNALRLAEVRAALADPDQQAVPILTLALDAGFGSLGPFNRAFKAETGTTPTAWRRAALGDQAPVAA